MKIDLSTIALILSLVVPGLVAQKSRRKISAQSFEATGPATELGELVALSLGVHLLLFTCFIIPLVVLGFIRCRSVSVYFQLFDRIDYSACSSSHKVEVALATAVYICLSMATGYLLGFLNGWFRLNHPLLRLIESNPRFTTALQRLGIYSLLEERPLSFELFTGEAVSRRADLIYFLELQLRNDKGFVTGELTKYAIVTDEESHRPVVLRDTIQARR